MREYDMAKKIAEFYEEFDPYGQGDAFDGIEDATRAFCAQLRTKLGALDLLEEFLSIAILELI